MSHLTHNNWPPDTQPLRVDPRPLACRIFLHSNVSMSSCDARMGQSPSQKDLRKSYWKSPNLVWSQRESEKLLDTSLTNLTRLRGSLAFNQGQQTGISETVLK